MNRYSQPSPRTTSSPRGRRAAQTYRRPTRERKARCIDRNRVRRFCVIDRINHCEQCPRARHVYHKRVRPAAAFRDLDHRSRWRDCFIQDEPVIRARRNERGDVQVRVLAGHDVAHDYAYGGVIETIPEVLARKLLEDSDRQRVRHDKGGALSRVQCLASHTGQPRLPVCEYFGSCIGCVPYSERRALQPM